MTSIGNNPHNMTKPSMFSLISQNGLAGATTIGQASQGHRFPNGTRCNDCTCSPGLLSRNRRSSLYLRRILSNSSRASSGGSLPSSPRRHFTRTASGRNSVIDESFASNSSVDGCVGVTDINTSGRLEKLRNLMKDANLGVYIVPSEDAHQSEYTSPVDQRRAFISGFSGSAGVAIITREISSMNETPEGLAFLATDGRYFTQAANELDFNWTLLKQGTPGTPTWQECAVENAALLSLDSGEVVNIGVDPKLITYNEVKKLNELIEKKLAENNKFKISLKPVRNNLVDDIWNYFETVPVRKFGHVFKLDDKYTGETTNSKVERLNKEFFEKLGTNTMFLNTLDEIAWLLNLRGEDIEYNPLFYSYLMINGKKLVLYTEKFDRFDEELRGYFKEINLELKRYDDVWFDIRKIATDLNNNDKKLILTNEASWKMVNCIIAKNFIQIDSPIKLMKEVKNKVEIEGQIEAQIEDGYALIKFFSWLENELVERQAFLSEYDAAMELLKIRSSLKNFRGLSFETISSSGSNAAIIHYSPNSENSSLINPNKIYLCDSGSQFLNGTTDTTRTLHFGEPSNEEIKNYTLVLKGHIAISKLKIPNNKITGYQIDCIARQFLWNFGLDYMHGTGHGVDSFGPVHSGGIGIGFRSYCNEYKLRCGNLLSNEPGYYKVDEYGIRIENMIYLKECEDIRDTLEVVTTTRVPYCKKLIDINLLNDEEKEWINEYHNLIWRTYEKRFDKKSIEWKWLKRETSPI
ncbi:hypothetical protein CANINC_001948 [Pichia inconspicua]|uniref:Xaa-Pro aminopeptidase n=1 Tax=Pichia inconspicua TaxID=52247 RepID=A0A4T0X2F2_9ASCO|nr:hypothetical protein CANINC_001948 [[Candida] inconspicua]